MLYLRASRRMKVVERPVSAHSAKSVQGSFSRVQNANGMVHASWKHSTLQPAAAAPSTNWDRRRAAPTRMLRVHSETGGQRRRRERGKERGKRAHLRCHAGSQRLEVDALGNRKCAGRNRTALRHTCSWRSCIAMYCSSMGTSVGVGTEFWVTPKRTMRGSRLSLAAENFCSLTSSTQVHCRHVDRGEPAHDTATQ